MRIQQLKTTIAYGVKKVDTHIKKGYHEFIQQIFDSEDSIWDTFIQFEDEKLEHNI